MIRYDEIGHQYRDHRIADERIVQRLIALLELPGASTVADIGAGTGNYANALADAGYTVQAIEPSSIMRGQAAPHARVVWWAGSAEENPLAANSVQGIISVLAIHHFSSLERAASEMARVCIDGNIVILTFDPRCSKPFWLSKYFPDIWQSAFRGFSPIASVVAKLEPLTKRTAEIIALDIPNDVRDTFAAAGWRRPHIYLDPEVRRSMSAFALADPVAVTEGLTRLSADLESGQWYEENVGTLELDAIDLGYRFIVLRCSSAC